jgi:hypothetical protein
VYSHHDDGGEDDEGVDVEELMRNVAPHVLVYCKGCDNFETLDKSVERLCLRGV